MKPVIRRLRRLEDQFGSADKPRPSFRLVVRDLGSKLCLADATCKRMLAADGTVMELVKFQNHDEGPDELTNEEMNRWVDSFPIEVTPDGYGGRR